MVGGSSTLAAEQAAGDDALLQRARRYSRDEVGCVREHLLVIALLFLAVIGRCRLRASGALYRAIMGQRSALTSVPCYFRSTSTPICLASTITSTAASDGRVYTCSCPSFSKKACAGHLSTGTVNSIAISGVRVIVIDGAPVIARVRVSVKSGMHHIHTPPPHTYTPAHPTTHHIHPPTRHHTPHTHTPPPHLHTHTPHRTPHTHTTTRNTHPSVAVLLNPNGNHGY